MEAALGTTPEAAGPATPPPRPPKSKEVIESKISLWDVGFPARTQETRRCVVGHLARVPAIHGPQRVDRRQQGSNGGRCTKVECLRQCWRVAAHLTVAFGEKMPMIEGFRLGQPLRLIHALSEAVPRHHGFDCCIGIWTRNRA